ncbi:MAG: HAMP domain-containing histidine kinase [Lewinellaceae bacterium]|nr:HAMP domain-containing histidine kinase [Lewinella sp.]MCB9277723.1 HAMP domain-containing histidine kinase [Lewinellaceae bacterium]
MNNKTVKRVVILGVVAMAGIIAIQSYWVISTWNINEVEFNQKVNLALFNTAKDLADLTGASLPARDVVKQRTTNYYIVNVAFEIDTSTLEYFLQRELESLAINIDYEYAVFDCHNDQMVYGNYVSYSPEEKKHIQLGNLPKDSEFVYYFGVKFPARSGYLFGKMQLSIFFSIILLVTVVFFAYAMAVMLRQKRLSEMQKDFINNMTHEFKTPISTIKISSDVLLNNDLVKSDNRLMQYAGIIRDQNQRLNSQVEKVLQLARIEGRQFQLKKEDIVLQEIIPLVTASCMIAVEKAGGKLTVHLPEKPVVISADRLHLTNILHNLLDNAVKYCREVPVIHVELEIRPKKAVLKITDQGLGISKSHQSHIFEKFYRVPTGNVHNIKGFGLGLFYVKNICRAHRWSLDLESELNQGTVISIGFPQASI